jgi:hypothetical protein
MVAFELPSSSSSSSFNLNYDIVISQNVDSSIIDRTDTPIAPNNDTSTQSRPRTHSIYITYRFHVVEPSAKGSACDLLKNELSSPEFNLDVAWNVDSGWYTFHVKSIDTRGQWLLHDSCRFQQQTKLIPNTESAIMRTFCNFLRVDTSEMEIIKEEMILIKRSEYEKVTRTHARMHACMHMYQTK